MKIELAPRERLSVTFKDSDGEIVVSFTANAIRVTTEWADTKGRVGVIYEEKFAPAISEAMKPILSEG